MVNDYKVLESNSLIELQQEVKAFLDIGWQPHGSMQLTRTDGLYPTFFQPITFDAKANE